MHNHFILEGWGCKCNSDGHHTGVQLVNLWLRTTFLADRKFTACETAIWFRSHRPSIPHQWEPSWQYFSTYNWKSSIFIQVPRFECITDSLHTNWINLLALSFWTAVHRLLSILLESKFYNFFDLLVTMEKYYWKNIIYMGKKVDLKTSILFLLHICINIEGLSLISLFLSSLLDKIMASPAIASSYGLMNSIQHIYMTL